MKLYAQHGFGNGEKIRHGLSGNFIDGIIYSPKDISATKLKERVRYYRENFKDKDILFDPQLYATFVAGEKDSRCAKLAKDYSSYFSPLRRVQLEREDTVRKTCEQCLKFQKDFNFTHIIAPSIQIPKSFDSVEALIAKNFIRFTKETANKLEEERPIYATLSVSSGMLRKHRDLFSFLNDITLLDPAPDGFYLVVSSDAPDYRFSIFEEDVLAGWMLLNYTLKENGFKVINGYSDLVTPILGIAGASAGATGWWSNLRSFSLDRFGPSRGGGRLPVPRYLSKNLFNRITYFELEQLRYEHPDVINSLPTDDLYPLETGSQPERNMEILQSWNALKSLTDEICGPIGIEDDLVTADAKFKEIKRLYRKIRRANSTLRFDPKSDDSHLDEIVLGLKKFSELAELDTSTE